jgi:hypothetical protein
MGYFKELPNVQYQSFLSDKSSSQDYLTVKNIFRRIKVREDLQNIFTLFNKYEIKEGSRPETVAKELYGDELLDWVVLISAGITNVRDQWPLSNGDLYLYAENKYGPEDLSAVRYYETEEVRDSSNRLIFPSGKVVEEDFTITFYDQRLNTAVTKNPVIPVSNFEHETRKNNEKSLIYVLKREYLQQFLNDSRKIMLYTKSSEYINDRLIKTENTNSTRP